MPSYVHIRFRPDPEKAGPGRAFVRTYTLQAGAPIRFGPDPAGARPVPRLSYIHVHFSFIHTYTLQLHTYIYTSGQTRKTPGLCAARAVPSCAHIRFRPDPACARPVPRLHAYMCTSASYIHIHFSFIHTYTLQLHTYIYTSGRTPKKAQETYGRTCLSGAVRIQVPSMGQVNPGPPYPALVQPSPALTRTQGVGVGVWTWCTRLTQKASEMSVALRFCCGA